MRVRTLLTLVLCIASATSVFAQLSDLDPDWKEREARPPATFRTDKLVPIDMPSYVSVQVGIDPDSMTLADDGIVRYVVVALSRSGNVNAAFEGIWCRTGQVKVYARAGNDKVWDEETAPQWTALSGNQRSMHALALARQGVCDGRSAAAHSAQAIIRKLRKPASDDLQR
jgi:hypothetical protein